VHSIKVDIKPGGYCFSIIFLLHGKKDSWRTSFIFRQYTLQGRLVHFGRFGIKILNRILGLGKNVKVNLYNRPIPWGKQKGKVRIKRQLTYNSSIHEGGGHPIQNPYPYEGILFLYYFFLRKIYWSCPWLSPSLGLVLFLSQKIKITVLFLFLTRKENIFACSPSDSAFLGQF